MLPRLLALLLILVLPACGDEVAQSVNQPARFQPWTDVDQPYRFRPGDEMDVRLIYNPELSDRVRVMPDGRITLSLIGSVLAEGRTGDELTADLLARYRRELRRPNVVVVGRQFESQRVYVGGEVRNPGVFTVPGRVGILEAVILAGGFKETARTAQVVLVRRAPDGGPMLRTVDTDALVHDASPIDDVPLRPGDIVLVPRSPVARVDLFVDQYIRQIIPFERSFTYTTGTAYTR